MCAFNRGSLALLDVLVYSRYGFFLKVLDHGRYGFTRGFGSR